LRERLQGEVGLLLDLLRLDVEAALPGRRRAEHAHRLAVATEAGAVLRVAGGPRLDAPQALLDGRLDALRRRLGAGRGNTPQQQQHNEESGHGEALWLTEPRPSGSGSSSEPRPSGSGSSSEPRPSGSGSKPAPGRSRLRFLR